MTDVEAHWASAEEGAELIGEGQHQAAVAYLTALIEREPENEYAYFFLGAAYYELEQYDRALKGYLTALELKPDYVGAMVHVGHALRMLGRYREAIRMAEQVLVRDKFDPDAYFLIGSASFARGDDARAKEFLEKFLQTSPELEVAHEVSGMLKLIESRSDADPDADPDDN